MDLVTVATLWFFGALCAGLAVGALVGHFTTFEAGLGAGLLIPGIVAAWFAWRCLDEYRAYSGARITGEVVAVEDVPVSESGHVTQPVPVIRFVAPDRSQHELRGAGAGGLRVGDTVAVLYDAADPQRSRAAQPSELRGGAIAMVLFGTFPLSLGLFFSYRALVAGRERDRLAEAATCILSPLRRRLLRDSAWALYCAMFLAIVWIGIGSGGLERRFVLGFGGVAVALVGYALRGTVDPRLGTVWVLGVLMLAVNFGVWAFALHLLL